MKNRYWLYNVIYTAMFLFFIIMVALPLWQYQGPAPVEDFFAEGMDYEKGWFTEGGNTVLLDKLNKVENTEAGKEFSIYNIIPEDIEEGDALCFRSKNIFFQVYVEGELLYEPYVPESPIYTESYGTKWNYVRIPVKDAGKQIEVRVTYVYAGSRSCIDYIHISQPGAVILNIIGDKLVAFVTCILLLFVGILLIVADVPVNMRAQKNHELRYLGLFALSIAIWCLSETNLVQFYLGDNRLMQVVSCGALMLIPIPTVLYLDAAFGFRKKVIVAFICNFSIGVFVLCWGLHFLHIADIHETLTVSHIMLAVTAVILFYTIIRNSVVVSGKQSRNVYRILRTIGLSAISVATVADIIRYYYGNGTDSAMFVRIGLLLFILCFGSSSLEKTINAVKLGVQSEFVAQLAYIDGLTRIGNRTSFQEHLVDLEKMKDDIDAIGIVMFDVNDLKYVNDNMGHHQGDDILVKSADIIRGAFEGHDCFRIGGDEFVVLLHGEEVQENYEAGLERFTKKIERHNAMPDKTFRISIAHGFAKYDRECKGVKLMDIYQMADKQMYQNKKRMKAQQIPPEKYYAAQQAKGGAS